MTSPKVSIKLELGLTIPLLPLLLLMLVAVPVRAEVATFTTKDYASYELVRSPNASDPFFKQFELEFRTSFTNPYSLIFLQNDNNEEIDIDFSGSNATLRVSLTWKVNNRSIIKKIFMKEPIVNDGEWHHLRLQAESGGQLVLDGRFVERLPSDFAAQFPWGRNTTFTIGLDYRGCIANASLDQIVKIPLHTKSELLNNTDYLQTIEVRDLPNTGPGCRQRDCMCLNRGTCIFRQWDLLDRCNCTRGYDGKYCQTEWDTCKNLETGPPCLNGGTCTNRPGLDSFNCNCATGFVGKLCQSTSPCRSSPCQNGGLCTIFGDPERQDTLTYTCRCLTGFIGTNCTEVVSTEAPAKDITHIIIPVAIVLSLCGVAMACGVAFSILRRKQRN